MILDSLFYFVPFLWHTYFFIFEWKYYPNNCVQSSHMSFAKIYRTFNNWWSIDVPTSWSIIILSVKRFDRQYFMLLCEHGLFTIPPNVFLWGFTFQKPNWSKELEKFRIWSFLFGEERRDFQIFYILNLRILIPRPYSRLAATLI